MNIDVRAHERILVALDVDTLDEADSLILSTAADVGGFKVGRQLMMSVGPPMALAYVQERGGRVFLDGKEHDIPETVAKTVRVATRMRPFMMNLHALGGFEMMRKAKLTLDEEAQILGMSMMQKPLLIAVTILTSQDRASLTQVGSSPNLSVPTIVGMLAELAKEAGLDGVVASPQETSLIRERCGDDFVIVTPGIREKDAKADDQKRTATAGDAIQMGATYLVIGRPITKAANPRDAARRFAEEVDAIKV
jgi:orotidine-5'-phosphate decarboxylase